MAEKCQNSDIGEIVRKAERDYTIGTTQISKYVSFNMHDTLERIDAYLNSKHISGEYDSLGREKPFFNIVTAAVNIWFRATDIDRKDIKVKPTKSTDDIEALLATIHLQEWMRRNAFGQFLNEWGRVLARYGSAVVKFIENSEGLHPMNIPWNRLIVDPVDFDNNVKIEVLELTEAQLRKKKGYDKDMVEALCSDLRSRETLDRKRKDNKADYIKLYEIHGELPKSMLTGNEDDEDTYVQQMQVISFLGIKGKRNEYQDYVLYAGEEDKDPYMITHLIKEDGRTLAIGAVEHLFEAQWMQNHTAKQIKDQLDLASKIIFQTADGSFVGQNAITSIENGDIMIHAANQPLTRLDGTPDIAAMQSFAQSWKSLGNEINGISESMLGINPPSGTAWRQTQALLQESHSLFELMTENKGLSIEEMLRNFILPSLKKGLDTSDEISTTLQGYNLDKIDTSYIKNHAIQHVNNHIKEQVLKGAIISPFQQDQMIQDAQGQVKDKLTAWGNQRFIKPSDIPSETWKELFKDLEWDLEVDVTGEEKNAQDVLDTLNTALQVIMNPAYGQNKQAQFIVGKILENAAVLSPMELASIPQATNAATGPMAGSAVASPPDTTQALPVTQKTNGGK